jgi:transposase
MDAAGRIAELESLIAQLQRQLAERDQQIEQLRGELTRAQEQIAALQREAARQAAPFRRRDERKIPPEQRKRPGRPEGHRGARRVIPAVVDERVEVPLPACPHCGGEVSDRTPLVQYIEEIPPVRPRVTRLVTWSGRCPKCGEVHSTHPLQTSRAQGAARVMLGPRALALGALLNKHLGLTMRSTCRVLKQLCGLSFTQGGLSQAVARVARRVADDYEALIDRIRGSPVVYADETSWWVGGPGWWLWVFTTPDATYYRVDRQRSSQVVLETLGDFAGVLVSDCLASYRPPPYRKHKCIAHHLRALKEQDQALRQRGIESQYLLLWKIHLKDVLAACRDRAAWSAEAWTAKCEQLRRGAENLLNQSPEQPEECRFRDRLLRCRDDLLGCLDDPRVEPTNNRAERALRPAVIARKLSCGNRTLSGRNAWQTLASLAQTCAQQAGDFVNFLAPRLTLSPQAG